MREGAARYAIDPLAVASDGLEAVDDERDFDLHERRRPARGGARRAS